MKKVKEFVKKYDNIIIVIISCLISMQGAFAELFTPYDNLWVFGNIYKLSQGKMIYRDVNIIDTPIYFKIGELIYRILGQNYLVFLIYGVIISTLCGFLVYRIFRELKISKPMSMLFTIACMEFCRLGVFGCVNYVIMAFLFIEIGTILFIKQRPKSTWIHACLFCITCLTYQKLGVSYLIAFIIIEFIICKSKKEYLSNICKFFAISSIIGIIYVLVELLSGNLNNFMDLCVFGLKEFTGNKKIDNMPIIKNIVCIVLSVGIALFIMLNKKIKENKSNLIVLNVIAICTNIIVIPIVNNWHVHSAMLFWIITILYEVYFGIKDLLNVKIIKRIINIIIIIATVIIIIMWISTMWKYIKKQKEQTNTGLFYGAVFPDELYESTEIVRNYITEKQHNQENVRILSTYSMLYTLNMNIDNGFFDMPLVGNFGTEGNQKLINEIKEFPKNTILLVENYDESLYTLFQFPDEVRDYVYNNYEYIERIENFDVYKIN